MAGYIAYLGSLVVFTFGALTFTVLAVSYFRERRPAHGRVFPAFTVLCAVAFLSNLLARPLPALGLLRELATGMLPAVLLHLVWPRRKPVLVFYCLCGAMSAAHLVNPDQLDWGPGATFGIAGLIGAIAGQTTWGRILPGLMFLSAAAAIAWPNPLLTLLPDYLLLAFFCVYLYYKERLVFFDLLIKRGAYFLFAVGLLTAFFAYVPRQPEPWMAALLLAPLWLIGPWLDRRLEGLIDRLWLRRKYAAPEAERLFLTAVQQAANEPDLQTRAEQRSQTSSRLSPTCASPNPRPSICGRARTPSRS